MAEDKRKQKRLVANLFAELESPTSGMGLGRAVVVDVSASGIAIDSEADLSIGEKVECNIEVPLIFQVKVVRVQSKGQIKRYGLQLMNQGFLDKMLIRKILKGNLRTRKVSL